MIIIPFAAAWMNLEIVIISKVSQIKRNTVWHLLYVKSKKKQYKCSCKTEGDSQT